MKKITSTEIDQVLDEDMVELLSSDLQPLDLPAAQMAKLRSRIMQRIDEEEAQQADAFVTIRADEGVWEEIAPKLYRKVLRSDPQTGVEAYLLRAEPGAEAPPHMHEYDELCLVLEGEVEFDNVHLKAGDYHFAAKGSQHSMARTQTGVLLFLQTAIAA